MYSTSMCVLRAHCILLDCQNLQQTVQAKAARRGVTQVPACLLLQLHVLNMQSLQSPVYSASAGNTQHCKY